MNLQPLGDRLIVEALEDEETTASGIVLPDTAKEKPQRGRVLAVGPGARNDKGELVPLDVAELLDEPRLHAGLLGHLPQRGRVGLLAGPDIPLRQRPEPGLLPRRTDRSHHPRAPQPTNDDGTSRELPAHKPFLTDGCSPGLEALHS